jgi:hypothetical protein
LGGVMTILSLTVVTVWTIDRRPALRSTSQAQRLAATHARRRQEDERRREALSLDRAQESGELVGAPGCVLPLRWDRRLRHCGRVPDDQAESLGIGERLAEHDVGVAHRLRAQSPSLGPTSCQQLLVQVLDLEGREGLQRDRTDPALDALDRHAVAVPTRRAQPGPHDL